MSLPLRTNTLFSCVQGGFINLHVIKMENKCPNANNARDFTKANNRERYMKMAFILVNSHLLNSFGIW